MQGTKHPYLHHSLGERRSTIPLSKICGTGDIDKERLVKSGEPENSLGQGAGGQCSLRT